MRACVLVCARPHFGDQQNATKMSNSLAKRVSESESERNEEALASLLLLWPIKLTTKRNEMIRMHISVECDPLLVYKIKFPNKHSKRDNSLETSCSERQPCFTMILFRLFRMLEPHFLRWTYTFQVHSVTGHTWIFGFLIEFVVNF